MFVSSVQKELSTERTAVARSVRSDPLLGRFFDIFLFEELPPKDRRADELYLGKVDQASIYLGIFGNEYGFEDATGVSPTEREFDRATQRGIPRLIFVKGEDDSQRAPKMALLIRRAAGQLIRRRFGSIDELLRLLQASLVDYLESRGAIQAVPLRRGLAGTPRSATSMRTRFLASCNAPASNGSFRFPNERPYPTS